jgi:hypothetical protein
MLSPAHCALQWLDLIHMLRCTTLVQNSVANRLCVVRASDGTKVVYRTRCARTEQARVPRHSAAVLVQLEGTV